MSPLLASWDEAGYGVPPAEGSMLEDVLAGLSASPRRLPTKYLYDARGAALFESITWQPEYYLTRTELALLDAHLRAIADAVGPDVHVVEYGSGSGRKTERLLAALHAPLAYTPVEISQAALDACVARLRPRFPAAGDAAAARRLQPAAAVAASATSAGADPGVLPRFDPRQLHRRRRGGAAGGDGRHHR